LIAACLSRRAATGELRFGTTASSAASCIAVSIAADSACPAVSQSTFASA
jgi:hypothetical protein